MTIRPLTILLSFLTIALAVIAGVPKLRETVRNFLLPDKRIIIAKVEGRITPDTNLLTILKVKTRDQYFIEIYKTNDELSLLQRISLEEPTDGQFEFQGRYTNLALADLDTNGEFEIVSPMYDRNGTPRLHIYKYNPDILTFEKLTPE